VDTVRFFTDFFFYFFFPCSRDGVSAVSLSVFFFPFSLFLRFFNFVSPPSFTRGPLTVMFRVVFRSVEKELQGLFFLAFFLRVLKSGSAFQNSVPL